MKNITDVDYMHGKRVWNKNLMKKYHDLYVQSDTLLVGDVFEDFQNMCLEINELDHDRSLTAPGLAW